MKDKHGGKCSTLDALINLNIKERKKYIEKQNKLVRSDVHNLRTQIFLVLIYKKIHFWISE
jgi:hypothetical protein